MFITKLARNTLNHGLRERGYSLKWMPPKIALLERTLDVNFDMVAAHLMLTVPHPFFVGIGANDGVTHDPLYPFIRNHKWRGVMVEPLPESFAALERNYTDFPEVSLVQAAIGTKDGMATIYAAEIIDEMSSRMSLHASFDRNVLLRAKEFYPDIESRIIERDVPILQFGTLIKQLNNPTIDVIKIDTEGHDLSILETIDFKVVHPRVVLAEHAHLSRNAKIRMADLLLDAGYRITMSNLDMLGYRDAV